MSTASQRSPLRVTLSVWRALFLREALTRFFGTRAGWVWVLTEPMFHLAYLLTLYVGIRVHTIGGIDTFIWLLTGLLGYFMFKRTATQVSNAVSANQALFSYRQVKPIDTALVRSAIELFLLIVVCLLAYGAAMMMGRNVCPADPLTVVAAFAGLWFFGIGFGLINSVANELMPEIARILNLSMTPLYFISGVMFPLTTISQPYRVWLMINPVAHGLESARLGFAPHYHAAPELELSYLYKSALVSIFIGLALYKRFSLRMVAQ